MTPTVFPCYAVEDRDQAASIAAFLEAGAGVRVLLEDGAMRPGESLVEKALDGRMADIILVLFSRHSLPSPWPRSEWEAALKTEPAEENVRIAFLKCDDCTPPRVLAPQFDLAGLSVPALRRLKRWVRTGTYTEPVVHYPELAQQVEALGADLADRPGAASVDSSPVAREFTGIFREDFDAILHLECGGRSLAALAGDLASQVGLRLEGDLDRNLIELQSFCADHRFLVWIEGASVDEAAQLSIGPRSSTLVSTEPRPEQQPEEESLRRVQYVLGRADSAADWDEICRLARLGVRLAIEQGRIAESYEILDQWHALADARGDRGILEESAREMVWILESWDRFEEARRLETRRATQYDDQMTLDVEISVPPPPQWLHTPAATDTTPEKLDRFVTPRREQFRLF